MLSSTELRERMSKVVKKPQILCLPAPSLPKQLKSCLKNAIPMARNIVRLQRKIAAINDRDERHVNTCIFNQASEGFDSIILESKRINPALKTKLEAQGYIIIPIGALTNITWYGPNESNTNVVTVENRPLEA